MREIVETDTRRPLSLPARRLRRPWPPRRIRRRSSRRRSQRPATWIRGLVHLRSHSPQPACSTNTPALSFQAQPSAFGNTHRSHHETNSARRCCDRANGLWISPIATICRPSRKQKASSPTGNKPNRPPSKPAMRSKARDCRAHVERMNRQLMRLAHLPEGKSLSAPSDSLATRRRLLAHFRRGVLSALQAALRERFPRRRFWWPPSSTAGGPHTFQHGRPTAAESTKNKSPSWPPAAWRR